MRFAAVLFACAASNGLAQVAGVQKVLFTGDPLPAFGPGMTYRFGGDPTINSSGLMALNVGLAGPGVDGTNNLACVVGVAGSFSSYFRSGQPCPGAPAGVLAGMSSSGVVFSDNGDVAFRTNLSGPGVNGTNDRGIITGAPGALQLAARTGTTPPGAPAPYQILDYLPVINNVGRFSFLGYMGPSHDNPIIWSGTAGGGSVLAMTGASAAGPAGSKFGNQMSRPSISDTGRVAFLSTVQSPLGVSLFAGTAGSVARIVGMGDAVPGVAGATVTELGTGPSSARNGDLAFPMVYSVGGVGGKFGVFTSRASSPSALTPVALASDTLPGAPPGAAVRFYTNVALGSADTVMFRAQFYTGGSVTFNNDEGVWMKRGGTLQPVVLEGTQAPGLTPGVNIGLSASSQFTRPNALDQFAMQLELVGPGVTTENDRALCVWDPVAGLRSIVREGDMFASGPGVLRKVQYIDAAMSQQFGDSYAFPGGVGGTRTCINDSGVVVFGLRFTDDTSGVYQVVIPAPASLALIVGAGIASCRRRARGRGAPSRGTISVHSSLTH